MPILQRIQGATLPESLILGSTPSGRHRFHALDALRGIAAVMIVFRQAPRSLQRSFPHNAFLAVDFFACLSGFVIAFAYERRLESSQDLGQFFIKRLIRLYPTYLLGIVLGTFVFLLVQVKFPLSAVPQVRLALLIGVQLAFLPNLHIFPTGALFPLDYPAWSMFYQLLANVAYGWLVCKRLARSRLLIALYLISFAVMLFWSRKVDVGFAISKRQVLSAVFRVIFSFVAGVLALRLFRERPRRYFDHFSSTITAIAIGAVFFLTLSAPFAAMQTKAFHLFSAALLFPALVFLSAQCKLPSSWTPGCALLGDLSYPIYLIHGPLLSLLYLPRISQAFQLHPTLQPFAVPAVVLVSGTASYIALKIYDKPLRAFLTQRLKTLMHPAP